VVAALLCGLAFLVSYISARRSLASGLIVLLAIGYLYGITRANFPSALSHFIFDSAALGFYVVQLRTVLSDSEKRRVRQIMPWLAPLIAWPVILLAFPVQEPEILLVGLRSSVFFLPFLWIGARLEDADVLKLAVWIAAFNAIALVIAGFEYVLGVERFYPRNSVTEIIYNSRDVFDAAGMRMFRIPATFSSAPAYAGTMVVSLPLLFGAWVYRGAVRWKRNLLLVGLISSIVGVFLAASRTHAAVLLLVLAVVTLSGHLRPIYKLLWLSAGGTVTWIVATNERMQRFLDLADANLIGRRVSGSVNTDFLDMLVQYPLGNGLGGGGTNIPYFFQHLVRNPVWIENEYARILMEQGIPGLVLWSVFLIWLYGRKTTYPGQPWALGRRLAWFTTLAYYGTGMIGLGILSSVPQTILMLLLMGWIAVRAEPHRAGETPVVADRSEPARPAAMAAG